MGPAPDHLIAVDGVTLACDDRGGGDATPLVLVHGFTGGRVDFADVIDALAEDRRVVAWDHRGHADSTNTGDPSTYTFDRLAADMAVVIDHLGLDAFHLLGHSMGGIVSMRYVLGHRNRVRSLILMDTLAAPTGGIPQEWIEKTVENGRSKGMAAVGEFMAGLAADNPYQPVETREVVLQRLKDKHAAMDVEAFAALGNELGDFPSMLDGLTSLACPVTVLVGAHDTGLRQPAEDMAAAVSHATFVVIDEAAHSPQDENPAAWLDAVRAHLDRAEA